MKRILGIAGLTAFFSTMVWVFSYAFSPTYKSSNTATADTTQNLCTSKSYLIGTSTVTEGGRGVIHGACVNSGTAGASLIVYDSSGTALNPLFTLTASTPMPCSLYDIAVSSGLTYTTAGTANITMTYSCF